MALLEAREELSPSPSVEVGVGVGGSLEWRRGSKSVSPGLVRLTQSYFISLHPTISDEGGG